jgi:curved DNA-binding protein CbpA
MSVIAPFVQACASLGLARVPDSELTPDALKRAYRRKVLEHPPDRDPEEFRRVRAAYELLTDPLARTKDMLLRRLPAIPPPELPPRPLRLTGSTAVAVLRVLAAQLDAGALLQPRDPPERACPCPRSTDEDPACERRS